MVRQIPRRKKQRDANGNPVRRNVSGKANDARAKANDMRASVRPGGKRSPTVLYTLPAVINALDGLSSVAELTGKKAQHVWNWKHKGKFPPATFLVITQELHKRGFDAPPELWRITTAPRRE